VALLHEAEENLRRLSELVASRFGRLLTQSFLLEMERGNRDGVPFLILTTEGG
jgi:hypothetical protein